jgi:hypothetical protein
MNHALERCIQLVGKPEGKDQLEDLDVDGELILEWVLKK